MNSFLAAVHRAARHDTAAAPPETGSHVQAPDFTRPTPGERASNPQADAIRAAAQAETYSTPAGFPDEPDTATKNHGGSKIIAGRPDADGAAASGGPFEPHPSSLLE